MGLYPDMAKDWYESGKEDLEAGKFDDAIFDLDAAIRLDPRLERAYAKRGYAQYRNGDFEHAFADFETALRLNPRDASVFSTAPGPMSDGAF